MDHLAVVQVADRDPQRVSPQFLPKDATCDNYKAILRQPETSGRPCFNSFGISLIATVLSVILATLAAYAIARLEFKGKKLVLSLALAIAMFPVVVAGRARSSTCGARSTCSTPGRA